MAKMKMVCKGKLFWMDLLNEAILRLKFYFQKFFLHFYCILIIVSIRELLCYQCGYVKLAS